jgi:predicted lipoprotein with Yx(FWY)xxD motif
MRNRWWVAPGLAAAAIALAACGSSGGGNSNAGTGTVPSGSGIKVVSTSSGKVLTNSAGRTLYWYAIDTSSKSNCTGTCAAFWPPVPASTKVASGTSLTGKFGSITGTSGAKQLTYMGHPLYTFKLDTASGQVKGNGITTTGGTSNELWWAMTPSGAKLNGGAPAPASTGGGGGGGYGY